MSGGEVTLMLTDMEGSTRLWDTWPELMPVLLERHDEVVAAAVGRHGGRVLPERAEGDSVFAVFDDSAAAVKAAVELQRGLDGVRWPGGLEVSVRVGIHRGPVPDDGLHGRVVNEAVRLRALARGEQVMVSGRCKQAIGDDDVAAVEWTDHGPWDLGPGEPHRVWEVRPAGWPGEPQPPRSRTHGDGHNLWRRPGPLWGRAEEVAATEASMQRPGTVLALVGPGGIGKTRLGLEVAWRLGDRMPDGVWWVDLAAAVTDEQRDDLVATALGVRPGPNRTSRAALMSWVVDRRAMVVLDSADEAVDDVEDLARAIVGSGAGMRVLITSRTAPRRAETIVVGPLDPGPSGDPAVSLLAERLAVPEPAPGDRLRERLEVLAERAGRVPLGLEVLAADLPSGSGPELVAAIDATSGIPHGEHDPVEAALRWSESRLDDAARAVLRRVSAFASPFDAAAAEVVAALDDLSPFDVLDALSTLVSASLLSVEDDGRVLRLRLLAPVRALAAERAAEAGEADPVAAAHLEWAHEDVKTWFGVLQAAGQRAGLARFDDRHAEVLAALAHSSDAGRSTGSLMAVNLQWFWSATGRFHEAYEWSHRLRDAHPSRFIAGTLRMQCGGLANTLGQPDEARAVLAEAVDVLEQVVAEGDPAPVPGANPEAALATAIGELANHLLFTGDLAGAERLIRRSLELRAAAGSASGELLSKEMLAVVACYRGDHRRAADELCASLVARRAEAENPIGASSVLYRLGLVCRERGRTTDAVAALQESFELARSVGSASWVTMTGSTLIELVADQRADIETDSETDRSVDLDEVWSEVRRASEHVDDPASERRVLRASAAMARRDGRVGDAASDLHRALGLPESNDPAELLRTVAAAIRLLDQVSGDDARVRATAGAAAAWAVSAWDAIAPGIDVPARRWLRRLAGGSGGAGEPPSVTDVTAMIGRIGEVLAGVAAKDLSERS